MRDGMRQPFPDAAKKASLWGAFFVCVVLVLAPLRALAEGCRVPGPRHEARVVRVVDGDTLRLQDGRSVRLIGLNAPEKARDGHPAEPFAELAGRHLEQLVEASDGHVVLVAGVQRRDRYGRSLAHAFGRDGRNWAAQQLAAGLGFAVAIAPNTALAGCLAQTERAARQARRGIWSRRPLLEASAVRRAGFALLRGRAGRVERNRGGVWLELDGHLVVHVAPQALAQFDARRLQALEGRVVEVRGWVVERRPAPGQARWLLNLSHPALLELP